MSKADRDWTAFVAEVKLYARVENAGVANADVTDRAKKIKSRDMYREEVRKSSNWLARAAEKIGALFQSKRRADNAERGPQSNGPSVSLDWLPPLVWTILGIGAVIGIVWALKQFSWDFRRNKKLRAMLEEDEPERSADEWLAHADGLAAQGKFREAVRSLYLACLVRLDEAKFCRFIRSETNWEHYQRLMDNPERPATLDFLEPTRRFDRVYYGFKDRGMEDVDYFREVYRNVCDHKLIRSGR